MIKLLIKLLKFLVYPKVTWRPDQSQKKIIRIIFFSVVAVIGLWVYGLKTYVDGLPKKPTDDTSITDGIVIFTGGAMRLGAGIELLNQDKAKRMLVSGVGERTSLDVLLIVSGKLPDNIMELKSRIDLGYEAKNTRGNALEVTKWVQNNQYKSIRLVTANYHMPRSYYEISNSIPDIKIIQNPVFPENIIMEKWWTRAITKRIMISEYNKYLVRRVLSVVVRD